MERMKAGSSSNPAPQRGAHTVVLGCAKADRGRMAPLVEALAAQELHVELVSGIDESRQRWHEAGQRYGVRAVYVACGGATLPTGQLAAVREELRALGIPPGSVWTGVVDWTQVDRLIRDIARMMEAAPLVIPAPPPLSAVPSPSMVPPPPPGPPPPLPSMHHAMGANAGSNVVPLASQGSIAPMMPPMSARPAAPSGLEISGGQVSLAPSVVEDGGSLEPVDPFLARPGGARWRVALGLGVAAVMVAGLVMAFGGDDDDEGEATTVAAATGKEEGPEPAAAKAERATDDEPAAERAAAPEEPTPPEDADAEPSPELDDDEADADPLDDDAAVHAALMKRKIRALDILLVSPEATRKVRRRTRVAHMDWASAQAHCEQLDIAGVKGWRLPSAGEFRTLSTSNMLQRRSYWSVTEADAFGSDRVVWNNLKKEMAPAPGGWKGGRVLCVRFQHPESFEPT